VETVCLKAMAKEPARRYATARDLADDLRRYLKGEPVRARRVGPAGRLWRWARRRPLVASLAAAVAVLMLAGTLGASLAAVRFKQLAKVAQDAAEREHDARLETEEPRSRPPLPTATGRPASTSASAPRRWNRATCSNACRG
jgi:hypothetical protein